MEISSREGLARALRAPDAKQRQAVLESLDKAFEEAQEQDRQINREALDELYRCYTEDGVDYSWYAYLLLKLNNPYSVEVAKKEFQDTRNNKLLLLAADHIARLPHEERLTFLAPLVKDSNNAARCRAAANMLDDCCERLEAGVALRAAIVSDHDLPLPELNEQTLDSWMQELQGPYPQSTETALFRLGEGALEFLLAAWQKLSLPLQVWVIRAATERKLATVEEKLKEILQESQDNELLHVALQGIETLGLDVGELVTPLCDHEDPQVRTAAIATGLVRLDWTRRFATEKEEAVRLAILTQIGLSEDGDYVKFLIRCLTNENWRVRAGAVDALVGLAPASLEPLRASLVNEDDRVRVAAVKGLYRLGKEEWIKTDLEATPLAY